MAIIDDERRFYGSRINMGTYRLEQDRRYWVVYALTTDRVHLRAPQLMIVNDFGDLVPVYR